MILPATYKRLANLLSEKLNLSYGEVMGWIKYKLNFALVNYVHLWCPFMNALICVSCAS